MTAALTDLFRAVKQAFADDAETTSVVFGERESSRQLNEADEGANRVVFSPVDGDSIGDIKPGREGDIGRIEASAVVRVWARDPDAPDDEAAQYDAARALFGKLYRYLWAAAAGRIAFGKLKRTKIAESLFGTEWSMTITVRDDLTATPDGVATDLIPDPIIEFTLPAATG